MNTNDYVEGHLEEALAQTGETDVHVQVVPGQVLITGNVTTEVRRDAITAIAGDLVEDLVVRNEVIVLEPREPEVEEHMSPSGSSERGER